MPISPKAYQNQRWVRGNKDLRKEKYSKIQHSHPPETLSLEIGFKMNKKIQNFTNPVVKSK